MQFLPGQRARQRHRRNDHEETADEHRDSAGDVVEWGVAREAGESRAIIAGLRGVGIQHLGEAVRPRIGHGGYRGRKDHRDRRPPEIHQRQDQDGEHGHLDLPCLDLLADIFRRAADHEASDENRDHHEQQHAVEAGADAADDDFPELHVDQRNHAAECCKAVMHGVDRAAGCRRGDDRKQRRRNDAEADFLAFHVAAGQPERMERGGAVGFRPVGDDDA